MGWGALAACAVLGAALVLNPHGVVGSMIQTLRLIVVLLLLGCAYLVYQLHQRSHAVSAQIDGVIDNLAAYRAELRKRRDMYHGAWRWSSLPILPALVVVFVGGGLYDDRPGKLWRYGLCAALAAVGICLGIIHYRHKGNQLQRELDALASMDEA